MAANPKQPRRDVQQRRRELLLNLPPDLPQDLSDILHQAANALGESCRLDPRFLLEVGAIEWLSRWECQGIHAHLEAGLPSSEQASRELAECAETGDRPGDASPLFFRVLDFRLRYFGRDDYLMLGADVFVLDFSEDDFMQVLAEFLWQHRHTAICDQAPAIKLDPPRFAIVPDFEALNNLRPASEVV